MSESIQTTEALLKKRALLENLSKGQKTALGVAETGGYLLPYVGSALSGRDALQSFGSAGKALTQSKFRKAGWKTLAGLGNTLMASADFIPFAGAAAGPALRGAARSGKVVKMLKGVKGVKSLDKGTDATKGVLNMARNSMDVPNKLRKMDNMISRPMKLSLRNLPKSTQKIYQQGHAALTGAKSMDEDRKSVV